MRSYAPIIRTGLVTREVDGECLVLDRQSEKIHQLNATAWFIWEHCDGERSIQSIAEEVAKAFGIALGDAERDVEATVARFQELGLLLSAVNTNKGVHNSAGP